MDSPTILVQNDRCCRSASYGQTWEQNQIDPIRALYLSIEEGLMYEGKEDPGQIAGDTFYTFAAERGLDSDCRDLYGEAQHLAGLADIVTWVVRGSGPAWKRPHAIGVGEGVTWESGAFLEPKGAHLKRLILVDRWSKERQMAEEHSWRTMGEMTAYELPMTEIVIVIGQSRDGRRHSPWTKAWTHPVNGSLRMRKRDGRGFTGDWKPVWREMGYNREAWLDCMTEDAVLADVLFEVPVEISENKTAIAKLMRRRLKEIEGREGVPPPQPSVCDWPVPCQFRKACWSFKPPSEALGFVKLSSLVS